MVERRMVPWFIANLGEMVFVNEAEIRIVFEEVSQIRMTKEGSEGIIFG